MEVNMFDYLDQTLGMAESTGVLLVSVDKDGRPNTMTIGWMLLGRFYHKNPVAVVAVRARELRDKSDNSEPSS
jgi:flavin reductase (DIM6/NTAB) family NADH-FMN oxidoreductase RutF